MARQDFRSVRGFARWLLRTGRPESYWRWFAPAGVEVAGKISASGTPKVRIGGYTWDVGTETTEADLVQFIEREVSKVLRERR
jgi:hypothetical protein